MAEFLNAQEKKTKMWKGILASAVVLTIILMSGIAMSIRANGIPLSIEELVPTIAALMSIVLLTQVADIAIICMDGTLRIYRIEGVWVAKYPTR